MTARGASDGWPATHQGTEKSRYLITKAGPFGTCGINTRPKAGKVWRFLVNATPGPLKTEDKRWIQVLIPPGHERHLFAARAELRIPGAAPMTYVDDPTPITVSRWIDEDEGGPIPGFYVEVYSPPRLVSDAWGRDPAQATAEIPQPPNSGPRPRRFGAPFSAQGQTAGTTHAHKLTGSPKLSPVQGGVIAFGWFPSAQYGSTGNVYPKTRVSKEDTCI